MTLSVNGSAILRGKVTIPAVGIWVADLTLDTQDALPTTARAVTIDLIDQELTGTALADRQGVYAGKLTVRIVGGAAAMSTALAAKKYRGIPASLLLTDLATETGETLDASVASFAAAHFFEHWSRAAGPASSALSEILRATSASWRITTDGKLWVGVQQWPSAVFEGDILEEKHGGAWRLLSPTAGTLQPGTTFEGKQIHAVDYSISGAALRAEAWAAA